VTPAVLDRTTHCVVRSDRGAILSGWYLRPDHEILLCDSTIGPPIHRRG
jgi:hypothetical protein